MERMKTKSETAGVDEEKQEGNLPGETAQAVAGGPSHENIQKRAYEIHLERGGGHGHDMEDWLEAERDLKTRGKTAG
jgi:hypothetical protein